MSEFLESLRLRVRMLRKRRDLERDLRDELAYHLEQRRAHADNRVPFGNVTLIQEECRRMWTFSYMEDYGRELRQTVRVLARAPAHTLTIIALLAVGIGANAAMFSLVNAIFIRELPIPEPERLIALTPSLSTAAFEDFRKQQSSFSGIAATGTMLGTVVAEENGDQIVGATGLFATGNYFEVLNVRAQLGRVFSVEDDRFSDPQPVMVLSSAFWRRQYGGDPKVLGRRILLSGAPFTVIGVTQERFFGELPGRDRDFWVPVNMQPQANPQGDLRRNPGYRWMNMIGRLKRGESLEQAQAEATVVYERMFPLRPGQQRDPQSRMQLTLASRGGGGFRRQFETPVQVLAGIVVILLLVICANVATLLLARGTARQREIAVRQAIGCTRGRLMRQFLTEGLVLATAGGLIGLFLAPSAARALLLMQPSFATARLDLSLDRNILLFGLVVSLLTAVFFSVVPAVRASRWDIEPALKNASRSATGGRQRALRCIIAVQAALCLILVTASLLFARSLSRLHEVELGFDYAHIVSVTVNPRFAGYRDDAAQGRLSQRLLDRLNAVPGVKSASAGLCAVLMGCSRRAAVNFEGREAQPGDAEVWINPVSPNYFETIGAPMLVGRSFGPQDRPGSVRVAVVTDAVAKVYLAGQNPLGKHFIDRDGTPVEVIGVVGDMKFVNPRDPAIRMIFLSQAQSPGSFSYIQVKVDSHPEMMISAVRRAIMEVDSKLFLSGPAPLEDALDHVLARDLLLGRASALFGAIVLVLACFGVYGVISYLVVARTTELGIRLAIGARPRAVLWHVMAHALKAVLPGVMLGILGALAAGRLVESLLFGISGRDPAVYVEVALALLLTTAIAAYIPALRASRIDPLRALRCE